MTPDEIAAILARLEALEIAVKDCTKNDAALWRMLYLIAGIGLGTGAITLSQVVG